MMQTIHMIDEGNVQLKRVIGIEATPYTIRFYQFVLTDMVRLSLGHFVSQADIDLLKQPESIILYVGKC